MIPNNERKIKIVLIGNSQVGKTAFIMKLIMNKKAQKLLQKVQPNKDNLAVNVHDIKQEILTANYDISLIDIKGSVNSQSKSNLGHEAFTKQTSIVMIFFDISNKESFDCVNNFWLKYAKETIKPKNIALIANQIDKNNDITIKSMFSFCKNNDLNLFFCCSSQEDTEWNCQSVLEDVILWHESKMSIQQIRKKKDEQISKPGFILSKIFKINSEIPNKQDENSKKRQKQREKQVSIAKMEMQLKKNELQGLKKIEDRANQIQKKLKQFFTACFGKQRLKQLKLQEKNQGEMLSYFMKVYHDQLQKQKSRQNQKNKMLKLMKIQSQKKIQQQNEKMEQLSSEKIMLKQQIEKLKAKIYKKSEEQQQLTMSKFQQSQGLREQIKQLTDRTQKAKQQIEKLTLQKNKYSKQLAVSNQAIRAMEIKKAVWSSNILSSLKQSAIQNIFTQIYKCESQHSEGSSCIQLQKLYQAKLCYSVSFHNFIDNKQKLLFIIEIEESIIVIYCPEKMVKYQSGKDGFIVIIKKNTAQNDRILIDLSHDEIWNNISNEQQINKNTNKTQIFRNDNKRQKLWKYDFNSLVFGKRQIVVRFMRKGFDANKNPDICCTLWVNDQLPHNSSLIRFMERIERYTQNWKLSSILGITNNNLNNGNEIKKLQIFTVKFNQ